MASEANNVFSLPINTGKMKEDLQTIPADEVILRLITCCNEIERERKKYNFIVEDNNRWKSNYDTAMRMVENLLNKK